MDLATPPGDPGLFGPDSVCWRVHDDFPTMMVGGIRALILQALHPLALAGVLEYSVFQQDMQGRLGRTAQFIAGTTYGSRRDADGLIDHVNRIHQRIRGTTPSGAAYSATDPGLLTWVHVAEASSFLSAYLRYMNPALPATEQDRYFAETACIARRLGALDVPETRASVDEYIRAHRDQLEASEKMYAAIRLLGELPGATPLARAMMPIFLGAAIQLLPDWTQKLLGEELTRTRHALVRPAMIVACATLRWAIRGSAGTRAHQRVSASPLKLP
ncbi:oxygenase MpaB family protein [Cupriavidus sp. CuC1]|uniref:oxygenase MpaB family protein n=1 Tax=Cupriavidus sp. CuC1 TaxID=3373131 RepID=UPI0037D888A3